MKRTIHKHPTDGCRKHRSVAGTHPHICTHRRLRVFTRSHRIVRHPSIADTHRCGCLCRDSSTTRRSVAGSSFRHRLRCKCSGSSAHRPAYRLFKGTPERNMSSIWIKFEQIKSLNLDIVYFEWNLFKPGVRGDLSSGRVPHRWPLVITPVLFSINEF